MRFLRGMYKAIRRLFSPRRETLNIQVAEAIDLEGLFDEDPRGREGEGAALAGDFKIFSSKDEYNREFLCVFQSFKSSFLLDYNHRDGHFRA